VGLRSGWDGLVHFPKQLLVSRIHGQCFKVATTLKKKDLPSQYSICESCLAPGGMVSGSPEQEIPQTQPSGLALGQKSDTGLGSLGVGDTSNCHSDQTGALRTGDWVQGVVDRT
jgi:hypothetical protein